LLDHYSRVLDAPNCLIIPSCKQKTTARYLTCRGTALPASMETLDSAAPLHHPALADQRPVKVTSHDSVDVRFANSQTFEKLRWKAHEVANNLSSFDSRKQCRHRGPVCPRHRGPVCPPSEGALYISEHSCAVCVRHLVLLRRCRKASSPPPHPTGIRSLFVVYDDSTKHARVCGGGVYWIGLKVIKAEYMQGEALGILYSGRYGDEIDCILEYRLWKRTVKEDSRRESVLLARLIGVQIGVLAPAYITQCTQINYISSLTIHFLFYSRFLDCPSFQYHPPQITSPLRSLSQFQHSVFISYAHWFPNSLFHSPLYLRGLTPSFTHSLSRTHSIAYW